MKSYVSYKTWKFRVLGDKTTPVEVVEFLSSMLSWMEREQRVFYTFHRDLLLQALDSAGRYGFNSLGRKFGIEPITPATNNAYNYAEMFRMNVLSSCAGALQRDEIIKLIQPDSTPESLQNDFTRTYPNITKPSLRYLRAILANPNTSSYTPMVTLPLWATDGHFCAIKRRNSEVFLTIRLPFGSTTLVFDLPSGKRFEGKICRPTVLLMGGKLQFNFSIESQVEVKKDNGVILGVDLGKVDNFVASVVSKEHYTTPLYPDSYIRRLDERIQVLTRHVCELYAKEGLCRDRGHNAKREVLNTERLRVRSKLSRLKRERRVRVASQIVRYAQKMGAHIIALEDLRWLRNTGRTWDHSLTQATIQSQAQRVGIRVRKVPAKNTSVVCPMCGENTTPRQRRRVCENCKTNLNRDVLASRNIAMRALKISSLKDLSYVKSVETRPSKPAKTPGDTTTNSSLSKSSG